LPGYLFNFVIKALQSQLPTLANLTRWGKSLTNKCPSCEQPQTNKHVLSNCSSPDALGRYTNRHDKILEIIASWFNSKIESGFEIFVDLPNSKFRQTADLFIGFRPDIVFVGKEKAYALELTVCHESNLIASKNYKLNKYRELKNARAELIKSHDISVSTCEVSVLGFLNIDYDILKVLGIASCDFNLRAELTKSVISETFKIIYLNRNN